MPRATDCGNKKSPGRGRLGTENLDLCAERAFAPASGSRWRAMSAMRERELWSSARREARFSRPHTRPGHGAVSCERRECRCAARGRPRHQEGHMRPLATACGVREQREHAVWVWPLSPPARRSWGAQLTLQSKGHASAATAIASGAGRAPSVAPGASPPQLALGAAPESRVGGPIANGAPSRPLTPCAPRSRAQMPPGRTAVGIARLAPLPNAAQGAPGPPSARAPRPGRA